MSGLAVGKAEADGRNPGADRRMPEADGRIPEAGGRNFVDNGAGYDTEGQDAGLLDNMMEWRCSYETHNWRGCDLQKQTEVRINEKNI